MERELPVYLALNIKEVMKYHLRKMFAAEVEVVEANITYYPEEPEEEVVG